ncbi:efflux RND transporter periplasmic adaptor subunit [bacterium]|nr:efflux RND transporter periplasmic adaptor subunit [bacterium]
MKFLNLLLALAVTAAAQTPPRNENTVVLDAAGVTNLGIETVQVEEADFERSIFVLGEIEHTCESHSVLSSRIAGRAVDVLAHEGEFVEKDQILGRVESRQPGGPPPVIDLKAPANGLIIRSELHLGGPVEPDRELMEILDLSQVWVIARVPQHQAAILAGGLTANVKIPAIGSESITAKFLRLGVGDEAIKSSVEAIFEIPNPGNRIRPGMRAELSLITSKREAVTSIPRDALQGDRSNRFVFIKDYELENAFVRVPVTVGEIAGDRVEILSGLLPGDEVVLKGAYSLSFAGKGSASLKEALDAAHGHPHKEDGTEMSAAEIAAPSSDGHAHDHGHGHGHGAGSSSMLVLFLSIACGVLFLLLLASPIFFRARTKA